RGARTGGAGAAHDGRRADRLGAGGPGRLMRALRIAYRMPLAIALLIAGLAIVILVFPRIGYSKRDRIVARWSGLLLRICGVRLPERPAPGAVRLGQLRGGTMLL